MAKASDIMDRANAEAPNCPVHNQQMGLSLGQTRGGNVTYLCGINQCGRHATGRPASEIEREIDNPSNGQQEAPNVKQTSTAASADQEHNAAVLKQVLTNIGGILNRGTDTINNLNRRNGVLVGQVASAGEFAVSTEQTDKSKQALDETAGLTSTMDQHLGGMSGAVAHAEEAVVAAVGGLRVVEEAEDDLRQAGAGTKAAAPARDGA